MHSRLYCRSNSAIPLMLSLIRSSRSCNYPCISTNACSCSRGVSLAS